MQENWARGHARRILWQAHEIGSGVNLGSNGGCLAWQWRPYQRGGLVAVGTVRFAGRVQQREGTCPGWTMRWVPGGAQA